MILGGAILGLSILPQYSAEPPESTYDTIRIYGESIVDKLRALTCALTEEEILAIKPNQEFDWTSDVILLAEFDNNLQAGNVITLTGAIEQWLLQRRRTEDTIYTELAELDVTVEEYIDYEAKSNKSYEYRLFAQSADELSAPLDADTLETRFDYYTLIEPISGVVYTFCLNTNTSPFATSNNLNVYEGSFTEHPYTSHSQNKYIKGTVNFLAGNIDNDGVLLYPQDYLEDLEAFIHDGNEKIFKDARGRGWRVKTNLFTPQYKDRTVNQLASFSFNFVEVGNLDS